MKIENALMLPEQEKEFLKALDLALETCGKIAGEIADRMHETDGEKFNINMVTLLLDRLILSFILNMGANANKINNIFVEEIKEINEKNK